MRANIIISGIVMIVVGGILISMGVSMGSDTHEDEEILTGLALINTGEFVTAGGIIAFALGMFLPEKIQQYKPPFQQPIQPQTQYPQQQSPQITQQIGIKHCKNCNAKLENNWVSCPWCGLRVT